MGCPTKQLCVSQCPNETLVFSSNKAGFEPYCDPAETDPAKRCPPYLVASLPVFGRCIPTVISTATGANATQPIVDAITNQELVDSNGQPLTASLLKTAAKYLSDLVNLKNTFELGLEDFTKSYLLIIAGLALGALIALVWIFVLRFIVKPFVFLTIFILLGLLGFGTYQCVNEYILLSRGSASTTTQSFKFQYEKLFDVKYMSALKETWLALSIITGVVFVVLLLVVVFLRSRIHLACELIREASKAMIALPMSFVWPLVPFVLQLAILAYCISTSLYLASAGVPLYKIVDMNTTVPLNASSGANQTTAMRWSALVMSNGGAEAAHGGVETSLSKFKVDILKELESAQGMVRSVDLKALPLYAEYVRANKGQLKPGLYCDPKTFEEMKMNATLLNETSVATLACNFYEVRF
jgi:hypothetical protein